MQTRIWTALITILFVCVLLCGQTVSNAFAQDQEESDKLKSLLLKQGNWIGLFEGSGGNGFFDILFEERGEMVIAKIDNPAGRGFKCERDVTITLEMVKFDGCRDKAITLKLDPNDNYWRFKGRGQSGDSYKMRTK